jgi:hypothetical protein
MAPKPRVTRSAAQTKRFPRSAKRRVETVTARRMSAPPIDGVPAFFLWPSGVSSRTLVEPYWSSRMRSMKSGPRRSPRRSDTSPAATIRKDG